MTQTAEAFETVHAHNGLAPGEQLLFQLLCEGKKTPGCVDCVSDWPVSKLALSDVYVWVCLYCNCMTFIKVFVTV